MWRTEKQHGSLWRKVWVHEPNFLTENSYSLNSLLSTNTTSTTSQIFSIILQSSNSCPWRSCFQWFKIKNCLYIRNLDIFGLGPFGSSSHLSHQWRNEAKYRPPRVSICCPLSSSLKLPFFTSTFFCSPLFLPPLDGFLPPPFFCPSAVVKSDGFMHLYNFLSVSRC